MWQNGAIFWRGKKITFGNFGANMKFQSRGDNIQNFLEYDYGKIGTARREGHGDVGISGTAGNYRPGCLGGCLRPPTWQHSLALNGQTIYGPNRFLKSTMIPPKQFNSALKYKDYIPFQVSCFYTCTLGTDNF